MTAQRQSPAALAEAVGTKARELAGKIRRMIITRASDALWQVLGHTLLDDEIETHEAELFGGIGFAARPNATEDVEAIVAFVGDGAASPIIIATRQEARRIAVADLAEAETQIHNSAIGANATLIRIKANGTVEIRTAGGVAERLPTMADIAALRATFNSHTHSYLPGPDPAALTAPPTLPAAVATGTVVLKAQ